MVNTAQPAPSTGSQPMRAGHGLERVCAVELPDRGEIEEVDQRAPLRERGPEWVAGHPVHRVLHDGGAKPPKRSGQSDVRLDPIAVKGLLSNYQSAHARNEHRRRRLDALPP